MINQRRLEDAAMAQELWSEATTEMFREDWEVTDQAEHYGSAFVGAVLTGELSRNQLKAMVKEANWLEREVIERSGGDIEALGDADYIEAMGRRIAHHALKNALGVIRYGYHSRSLLRRQ